jgi:uncharacterized iron-regulated membrane protein
MPIEEVIGRVTAEQPDLTPTAVTVRSDPHAPVAIAAGQRTIYADAYSGTILGEPTRNVRALISELRAWHRWLAIEGENRPIAKAITGWSNFIFLFIVLSGMYLWIPRRWSWQSVGAVVLFRGGLSGKARDFNWHNVIGIWSAVPLALVVATAMPISFPWATTLIYRAAGEEPPRPNGPAAAAPREGGAAQAGRGGRPAEQGAPGTGRGGAPREGNRERRPEAPILAGLNARWATAERQVADWKSINLRLPTSADSPLTFTIDRGNGGQPQYRSTLIMDGKTGEVARWETFENQSLGRRLRSWSRFTHTGEAFGLFGQTIAGLVSLGAVVLVYTGLALAYRRFFGRKKSAVESTREAA